MITKVYLALLILLFSPSYLLVAAADTPKTKAKVAFSGPHQIAVDTSTSLSAWLFTRDNKPKPVILAFTPYSPQALAERAVFFAEHDYVFLIVSSRGRGDSGGTFQPFSAIDGLDAASVIQWAATQPWSDGQVAMWGGSYVGYSQWAALSHLPDALKTIVPAAAVFPGIDYPAYNNIRFNYSFQWLEAMQGRGDWFNMAFREDVWAEQVQHLRKAGQATASLAALTGSNSAIAEQWLEQPLLDNFWQQTVPSGTALQQVRLPVLTITGYFDADQRGAVAHHQRYVSAGAQQRLQATLLIGPWDHSGTRSPSRTQAGIAVEEGSVLDMNALHLSWYNWVLKQQAQPVSLRSGIHYFLMGANEWRHLELMPAANVGWHLHPAPGANFTTALPGLLSPEQAPATTFSYEFDPQQAALTNPVQFSQLANEQRDIRVLDGDGLVFVSEPFPHSIELVGMPKLTLQLSVDAVDADIYVLVEELLANGETLRLSYDMQRLRHLTGLDKNVLLQPGKLYPIIFDSFTFIARRLAAGSRLRLSLHSNPPLYLEHNYSGPSAVSSQIATNPGTVTVKMVQTAEQPNILWLPLQ
ncbi:CocE/NonD family hydrolase [Arsukibacterium sp.]|uniref:CocE/NonD family hydrolase n=1 Tax=Arsukibacterium sp. TaxID=1977258 RepID=UPI002FD933D7